ncbi:hypothetical protein [Gluconacetobacter tumulicola]|uniref:Plasmid segregation centromere-binding protein ParG n=1 Tax=Gluconacetobacter tumulicola TaxID=1017177 RepID=A0A7W4JCA1_9PROT|nr:hypothetical protein [Gluconacetobacter tumulicola]MBB2178615.1 hypothetical protein [Gluconacetobacter tumulicola]
MTVRRNPPDFVSRPADPERWVKAPDKSAITNRFTARLTIDVTPALRARLKVAAFQRGITVADMLRVLLAREFPDSPGDTP